MNNQTSLGKKILQNPNFVLPLALAVMFFWGSLFPMIKIGYAAFGVNTAFIPSILLFAGIRFVACGLLLIGGVSVRDRRLRLPQGKALGYIVMIALTGYVLHYACTYIGVSHLPGSKTAILKQIGSLFIICFAFLFRREDRFTPAKLVGGLLGFFSIIVINLSGLRFSMSLYDALILCASFCSVASVVFSKNAYDTYDPMYVTAWAQLLGGIVLLTLGISLKGSISTVTPKSLGVMAYMCFASCMGYALWNCLLKYNDMSRLTVIKFTESLFSALCSWALLGENIFKLTYLISFVLVCVGILISGGHLRLPVKNRQEETKPCRP